MDNMTFYLQKALHAFETIPHLTFHSIIATILCSKSPILLMKPVEFRRVASSHIVVSKRLNLDLSDLKTYTLISLGGTIKK